MRRNWHSTCFSLDLRQQIETCGQAEYLTEWLARENLRANQNGGGEIPFR